MFCTIVADVSSKSKGLYIHIYTNMGIYHVDQSPFLLVCRLTGPCCIYLYAVYLSPWKSGL